MVTSRIHGKETSAVIVSGATRCLVSIPGITAVGLKGIPRDILLEVWNALSRGDVPDVLIVTARTTLIIQ